MHRIDTPTRAIDLFGTGKDGFRDGDPLAAILATRMNAKFFNMLQETICRFIEGGGIELSDADYDQLSAAFNARLAALNFARLDVSQLFSKAQGSEGVALIEGSPVGIDLNQSNYFTLALSASCTLGDPDNVVPGRPFAILIQQPVGGGCGLSFGANWDFENDEVPENSQNPNAADLLIGIGLPGGRVFGHMKLNIL